MTTLAALYARNSTVIAAAPCETVLTLLNDDARLLSLLLQGLIVADGLRRLTVKSPAMTDGPRMPQLAGLQIGTLGVG